LSLPNDPTDLRSPRHPHLRTPFQNPDLARLARESYRLADLALLEAELRRHGTLEFVPLPSGLFSASPAGEAIAGSGYGYVWVRDNVYVAYAHLVNGEIAVAAGVATALLRFFTRHRQRFDGIISGTVDPGEAMNRPHIRFDGSTLEELPERWPHAQNDALGYFLWLYAQLALGGHVPLGEGEAATLALFPAYFRAIRFWQDEDSGHWEEVRKVSASSIGTVVAGLEALLRLARERPAAPGGQPFGEGVLRTAAELAARGRQALAEILPQECAQLEPAKNRRYDAALTFLVHPLAVVDEPLATLVLHDMERYLTGAFGIRRYLGDSYYAPDFDRDYAPERRTTDHSAGTGERDVLLREIGEEAQWCLFDPMLSAGYGARYLRSRAAEDHARQVHHFHRALAQVTPRWQCPELYYLQTVDNESGLREYHPNRHLPLQWTQANLVVALEALRTSISGRE
jgi:phosphorylase kinase alpha/beta subunit